MSRTYKIERASSGRAKCGEKAKCLIAPKSSIARQELRIGVETPSPFHEDTMMTKWYHVPCMFSAMKRMRKGMVIIQKVYCIHYHVCIRFSYDSLYLLSHTDHPAFFFFFFLSFFFFFQPPSELKVQTILSTSKTSPPRTNP
jgi:Poly(ADP-ribose) polymerase and DNA-Ligase Zn-finger region